MAAMRTTKQNTNIIFTSFNLMRSKRQEAALIKNKASLLFALFYILFHLLLPSSSSFSPSSLTHTHTHSLPTAPQAVAVANKCQSDATTALKICIQQKEGRRTRRARPAMFENCNYFKGFFMLNSNAWHINTHTHKNSTHTHALLLLQPEAEIKTTRRRHIELSSAARGLWGNAAAWGGHGTMWLVVCMCVCVCAGG